MNDEENTKLNNKKNMDDVVFEDVDSYGEEVDANPSNLIKKLKERIKRLEREKEEYLTGWQKDKADFINLRKKDEEAKKTIIAFAKEDLIAELIPTLDSFELAMKNKEAWEKVDSNWRVGVEYIASQFNQILENNGLKKMYPLGQAFDHTRDEAIEMVPVSEKEKDNLVLEVIATGYMIGSRVIRAPKVKVGEYKE